jgi:hypothetical protein
MDADKFEKAINHKPLWARAKHVGLYLRLKNFFTFREGIATKTPLPILRVENSFYPLIALLFPLHLLVLAFFPGFSK